MSTLMGFIRNNKQNVALLAYIILVVAAAWIFMQPPPTSEQKDSSSRALVKEVGWATVLSEDNRLLLFGVPMKVLWVRFSDEVMIRPNSKESQRNAYIPEGASAADFMMREQYEVTDTGESVKVKQVFVIKYAPRNGIGLSNVPIFFVKMRSQAEPDGRPPW